jgi:GntR family transcriptional regulator
VSRTEPASRSLIRDRRPLYLRVTEAILRLAAEQELQTGDRLPSELELAALFGVGRSTIREAMSHLELRGTVARRRGVGTILTADASKPAVGLETLESLEALAARQGWTCTTSGVELRLSECDEEQARPLRVEPGAPVSIVTRLKMRDGTPISDMLSIIPTAVVPFDVLNNELLGSVTDLIVRRHSPPLRFAHAEVNAVASDARLAQRLEVREGDPLVVVDELFIAGHDTVLAWNVLHFVPGRIRLELIRKVGTSVAPAASVAEGANAEDWQRH